MKKIVIETYLKGLTLKLISDSTTEQKILEITKQSQSQRDNDETVRLPINKGDLKKITDAILDLEKQP